jgi:hypothetical protein
VEREERGVEEVPKVMRGLTEPLHFLLGPSLCHEPRVLGDRFSDRRVQAPVQRMKLLDGDRCVLLDCDLGDGLADVSVVVDDLRHVEPRRQQLRAVPRSRGAYRVAREGHRRRFQPECLCQLCQEERHAVLDLPPRDRWPRPAANAVPRAVHNVFAMHGDEFVQHDPPGGHHK